MTKDLRTIEYDKILEALSTFSVNSHTKEQIRSMLPSKELTEVRHLLDQTGEAVKLLFFFNAQPLGSFDSILEILVKSSVASVLSMSDLLKIMRFLRISRIARSTVCSYAYEELPLLNSIVSGMYYDKKLEDDINLSILSETEMSDRASEKLASIRKKIRAANDKIRERLQSFIRSESKYLQDNIITIREGRFVLPVKSECRGNIPGLLHDQSASGATVYIEPMSVVESNNEIKSLLILEQQEIEEILKAFSVRVSDAADQLKIAEEACTMLDIILAKAKYSMDFHGTMPDINHAKDVKIVLGRHPLIDKDKVVPINLEVGKNQRIMLVSGPNTGGKTVSLKTVALFSAMAASGIFIPAKTGSSIAVFDNIYCDIGDEQSIEQSLSTFSSHIRNIKRICSALSKFDLVLLDEVGAGTDPKEGAALAKGILDYLSKTGCIAFVTTHYSELKQYALTHKEIGNASMEFDERTLLPTFRILMGVPGSSNALAMAEHIGLNKSIIDFSKAALGSETTELESLLREAYKTKVQAEQDRNEAEIKLKEAEAFSLSLKKKEELLEKERQRINDNARIEIRRIVQNSVARANELIDEIKENVNISNEKALLEAKHARNEIEDLLFEIDRSEMSVDEHFDITTPLKAGEDVLVKSLNAKAKVKSLPNSKGDMEVLIGTLSTKVNISDLARIFVPKKNPVKQVKAPPRLTEVSVNTDGLIKEIKLLGSTVDEAEVKLDEFIEDCIRDGIRQIKIIHGLGTGALRRGVQEYLKRNRNVESQRAGKYGEGDRGVTFAVLK